MAMLQEFNVDRFTIQNGFVLVIVNGLFQGSWLPDRPGAELDKTNIVTFCKNFGYTFHIRENLKAQEMKTVFENISNVNFSIYDYDAFICFVSSHGDEGDVIYGVDGEHITVDEIVSQFKGTPSLVNKPKLFFMQNCRGRDIDLGHLEVMVQAEVQADHGARLPVPIRLPVEADVLVSYSSVNRYESYRDINTGSWFITVLTKVLNELAQHNVNLTDMLSMVSKKVASLDVFGRKQMPCFTSTLRKPVYFVMRRTGRSLGRTLTPDLL